MLEAHQLCFAYRKNKPVFVDFDFSLSPGERLALVAPSGFGKTTLCRLLAGFERPDKGRILVDDKALPIHGVMPVQLIGQHPELSLDPHLRMKQSLAEAGINLASSTSDELLGALDIRSAWLERFPHELSGGELQRFCIARAVAANPRYLIADEISTMLDAVSQAQIWKFLIDWQARTDVGILFVSHSPALRTRLATHTIQLDSDGDDKID